MTVEKSKSHSTRLLSDKADEVCRSAASIVRTARVAIHKSENLVAKSREMLDRTEKELKELRAKKTQRTEKKITSRAS